MGWACGAYGGQVLVGKPEGKGARAIPSNRCEYNIKIDITETGLDVVD